MTVGKKSTSEKATDTKNKKKVNLSKVLDNVGVSVLTFLYKNAAVIVMAVATLLAVWAKCMVAPYPTQDVVGYVFKWMDEIKEVGISNFYTIDSDYSPLYLFFIGLLSLIPKGEILQISGYTFGINWMMALKCCYFAVDVLNAFAIYLIVYRVSGLKSRAAVGYIIIVALPVQFINSAVWGNVDCIYACFLLYSLYFALSKRGWLSFLLFGFALANKLQALFLAPFLVYLLLRRRVKFSAILYVPIAVFLSFLPAYFCGASFLQPFAFFGKQLGGYQKLTLGCPNFWQLFAFRDSSVSIINRGATYMGLLFIGVLFAVVWLRRIRGSEENLLTIAIFLIGITIFFLPHMHERYFYLVDVLVVAYALVKGKRYFLIPLMQMASGIAYYHYISGRYFIHPWGEDSVHLAAFMIIVVLGVIVYDLLHAERQTLNEVLEELK